MRRIHIVLAAAAFAVPVLAGCEAAPRVRPVKMGPVDTGNNTVEAVRRQLEGTWELVTLDVYSSTGQKETAQAQGHLTYDKYGNMSIKGTIKSGQHIEKADLDLSGRVTIDPDNHIFRFGGITSATADDRRVDPKLDPNKVRYYEFEGELLKTTTKNADGVTTATLTWKKVQ
jgi:hypothetical protein